MTEEVKEKVEVELDRYADLVWKLDEAKTKIRDMEHLLKDLKEAARDAKPRDKFSFGALFLDDNSINEKSIIGFASFLMMVMFGIADLVTGYVGTDLVISDTIYTSFVVVTLGSFGIAEAGKAFGKQ